MTPPVERDDATEANMDNAMHAFMLAGKLDVLLYRVGSMEEEVRALKPLMLERSGRQAEIDAIRKSLDESHDRHRAAEAAIKLFHERMDRMDARWYKIAGGSAVLNFLLVLAMWFLGQKGRLW